MADTGGRAKPPENRLKLAAATGPDMQKITPALNVRGVGRVDGKEKRVGGRRAGQAGLSR